MSLLKIQRSRKSYENLQLELKSTESKTLLTTLLKFILLN